MQLLNLVQKTKVLIFVTTQKTTRFHQQALNAKLLGSGYFAVDGNLPLESILP